MPVEYGIYTNNGDCVINEDFAAAYEGTVSAYVLADGLGGHGGGDIASHLVVQEVLRIVSQAQALSVDLLKECFTSAQEKLLQKQKELARTGSMKTTLVVFLTDGKKAMWGHIGDSRLYYCKKKKVKSRTLDHSVPQMLVKMKKIKEKDIKHHEERNVLLKVMGVSWGEKNSFEIDCKEMKLSSGDSFILCSDGFWEWIEDDALAVSLSRAMPASVISSELGDEAYSNGMGTDRDNITNLVIKII